jgi:hypothetical protein
MHFVGVHWLGPPGASTETTVPATAILPAVVIVLVIAMIVAMVYSKAHVDVIVDGTTIHVRPRGLDVLWCLSAGVSIPVGDIMSALAVSRSALPRRGLRLPGSNIPGIITAGSYGTGDARTFWDVRRADIVVAITCVDGAPYRQIVIEVDDPEMTAARLRTQLAPR